MWIGYISIFLNYRTTQKNYCTLKIFFQFSSNSINELKLPIIPDVFQFETVKVKNYNIGGKYHPSGCKHALYTANPRLHASVCALPKGAGLRIVKGIY